MVSYADEQICHTRIPLSILATVDHHVKVHDVLPIQQADSSSFWVKNKVPNIRKIALSSPNVPVAEVAKALGQHYKLVALKMKLQGGRAQTWANPEVGEKIAEIEATRTRVKEVKNNGGQGLYFFEKLLRMQEAYLTLEWSEGSQRLLRELKFRAAFRVLNFFSSGDVRIS